MQTTFTKLKDGSWGLKGQGLQDGSTVLVSKKDGSTVRKTVGKVLARFADGNCLATITEGGTVAPTSARTARRAFGHQGRYECDECGEFVTPGTQCWETGCRH